MIAPVPAPIPIREHLRPFDELTATSFPRFFVRPLPPALWWLVVVLAAVRPGWSTDRSGGDAATPWGRVVATGMVLALDAP